MMLPRVGQYTTCTAVHGSPSGSAQTLGDHTVVGLGMKEGIEQTASTLELADTRASQGLVSLVLSTQMSWTLIHAHGDL